MFVCDSIKLRNLLDSRIFEGNYYFFLRKYLYCKLVSLLVSRFVLWSRNVHRQQPERSEIFIFSGLSLSGLSLARFKITVDILTAFAGEFFTEEIKDTESL